MSWRPEEDQEVDKTHEILGLEVQNLIQHLWLLPQSSLKLQTRPKCINEATGP